MKKNIEIQEVRIELKSILLPKIITIRYFEKFKRNEEAIKYLKTLLSNFRYLNFYIF